VSRAALGILAAVLAAALLAAAPGPAAAVPARERAGAGRTAAHAKRCARPARRCRRGLSGLAGRGRAGLGARRVLPGAGRAGVRAAAPAGAPPAEAFVAVPEVAEEQPARPEPAPGDPVSEEPAPAPAAAPAPAPPPPPPPGEPLPTSLQVLTDDRDGRMRLTLSSPSVAAGEVPVEFNNAYAEDPHDLIVEPLGDDGGDVVLFGELDPGEVLSRDLRLGTGRYRLYCGLGDHAARGMAATLRVEGPRR